MLRCGLVRWDEGEGVVKNQLRRRPNRKIADGNAPAAIPCRKCQLYWIANRRNHQVRNNEAATGRSAMAVTVSSILSRQLGRANLLSVSYFRAMECPGPFRDARLSRRQARHSSALIAATLLYAALGLAGCESLSSLTSPSQDFVAAANALAQAESDYFDEIQTASDAAYRLQAA